MSSHGGDDHPIHVPQPSFSPPLLAFGVMLIGFGVLLVGTLAMWWARPRIAAMFAGPRVIEQDRIERAWKVLGWSDPWDEHLRRKR